jgi:N6-L-threonylcarbamoyladenine synthase
LERKKDDIHFPLVCLTVSGWHNDMYFMNSLWEMERIWTSTDDSAWESYDKVAKMMGLSYPWWPIISQLAAQNTSKISSPLFPRVWLDKKESNFSFSWLKSAVKREVEKRIREKWMLTQEDTQEISYEFQNAVNEVLAYKLIQAWEQKWVQTIMLAGWVSANDDLKSKIQILATEKNLKFIYPKKNLYCMDNAAMIWILAYYKIQEL